ncbi:choice-of-anchor E domain-containing protein [Neptunomonas antarctica]|uniref:PEP-CTERM protein-sorting domain-containing protein n=1 Tax=Neptunomonas antarctica TaxID=619304 RepID=A0A1N7IY48_9GAMM|nr:choice-of-anchor E domain-containing protein [Neptunomonas antarctica]SIS42015.1 PEP-CTERM protein-sorting domain-containing protein [Neptunomonas antarctica]
MSAFTKIVATAALTLAASTASAALIEVQSQSQSTPFSLTSWNSDFTFNLFDSSLVGGATLQRVELSLFGQSISDLTFSATTDSWVIGSAGSSIFANLSIGGGALDIDISPSDSFGNTAPGEFVAAGTTLNLPTLTGSDADMLATIAFADLLAFTGPGTFNVGLLGLGSLTLQAFGGNVDTVQDTQSKATFGVSYFINEPTTVPNPGTLALLGLGLLAMRFRKSA